MKITGSIEWARRGIAGVAMLVIMPALASAAPVGTAAGELARAGRTASAVEKAALYCRWHRGVRYCTWGAILPPEAYPTGSAEWWRAMEAWGRTGNGGRR
jgi:hypothetical protein